MRERHTLVAARAASTDIDADSFVPLRPCWRPPTNFRARVTRMRSGTKQASYTAHFQTRRRATKPRSSTSERRVQ